ncbi:MAG TPA: flagellar biosynthetic protein FliO [Kofleriaceae bacterium]|jgi:flagellar biogenesis protein FliO
MRFATSIVLVALTAGAASADNKVEVLDRGNAVEVIAHDMKALKTDLKTVRSRLEIPVDGGTLTQGQYSNDKTVKLIELTGHGAQKNLSVKLAYEHDGVLALSKQSQVIQVGTDLHIIVPRVLPAAGTTADLPEPTLTPELAAKAAAIAPVPVKSNEISQPAPKTEELKPVVAAAPVTATVPAIEAPKAAAVVAPSPAPVAKAAEPKTDTVAAKTDAPKETKTDAKSAKIGGATEPTQSRNFSMMIALGLAAVGCFAWMKRKKANPAEKGSSIEVIAQKSLGGKAKIVWLQAGGRDIVVAVTGTSVTTLGNWKKSAIANQNDIGPLTAALPEMTALGIAPTERSAPKATSTAVSGLLKLRARTNVPAISDDVATDDADADAIWAKEILAATGARR